MASVSTHENQEKSPHLPPLGKQSLLFCPKSKLHIHRGEIAKIIRECQEESFWKRALPFSLVSMLVTQGLVHQGYLAANPRFGSLPKVAPSWFTPTLSELQGFRTLTSLKHEQRLARYIQFPFPPRHP
ncbi:OCIA domain-containing protein 2 isoform X2 [Psammomys obesus]|uniref:OCIA domain-containing protein 2 isoform X2 n=1 Tax=Psammomys obesus TaxID=48139 RepID=UPI0024528B9B|nr:OCIA domain-containing protein 2 isoform X2 [Psammomys obesus]